MKQQEGWDEEKEELPDFLRQMKGKGDGFRAPGGYFDTLGDEVLRQVHPSQHTEAKVRMLRQPRYLAALAVAASVLLAAAIFLLRPGRQVAAPADVAVAATLENIPDEALQAYISDHIEEFDGGLILETHFAAHELPDMPSDSETEAMEKYLDNALEDLELEDLEEML